MKHIYIFCIMNTQNYKFKIYTIQKRKKKGRFKIFEVDQMILKIIYNKFSSFF